MYQSKYLQFKVHVKLMSIPEDSEAHVHVHIGINHRSGQFTSVISTKGSYTKMTESKVYIYIYCTLVDSVATHVQVYQILVENQLYTTTTPIQKNVRHGYCDYSTIPDYHRFAVWGDN